MQPEDARQYRNVDPVKYLQNLACHQKDPLLHIEREPLATAMEQLGAKGLSVPDPQEPYQLYLPLYIGITTPRAITEVPHWHPDQAEAYVPIEGEVELLAKYRWDDKGWVRRVAQAGDVLVVQPEVCHWLRWRSTQGLTLVFKAPQRPGVGRFPAGKVVCEFCPHLNRGCVLPDGFIQHRTAAK
jgi:hypothetical protein